MSLLFPLMAFGAVAIGIPIWLHLRRRDEKDLVEFSTLRFLDDQPVAKARPLWPHHWPLLLLRIAALLLLVAAFAWPYIEDDEPVIVEESRVYLLDNTLSHQRESGFENARDEIADELAKQDLSKQISVIELSTTAQTLVRFGDDPNQAADTIRELEPSAESGNFVDAFRAASELLNTSLGSERSIILRSDSQSNQWTVSQNAPPFLDADIRVELPEVSVEKLPGVSLSDARSGRFTRNGKSWIQASVTITRQGDPGETEIAFFDGEKEVFRQVVAWNEQQQVDGYAGTVLTEWESDPERWMLGKVVVQAERDALESDNRTYFSLPPVRPGKVELISNSLFLKRALDPTVMMDRWDIRIANIEETVRDKSDLPDVLCVDARMLLTDRVRKKVRDDLSRGCGVMLMVDESNPLIAGFLRDLGIDWQTGERQQTEPKTFRYVFGEHPIFAPFRSSELGNLAEIEFSGYRKLQVRDAVPLAFSASGDPLIFEVAAGAGRMLVFAFSMDRKDSNWPIHPTFIPFLDKTLTYLRGQPTSVASFEPGEAVTWELPPGVDAEQISVESLNPDGSVDSAAKPQLVDINDREARFRAPGKPGNYGIRYGTEPRFDAVLDVNPSPLESELRFEPQPAAVAAWTLPEPENTSEITEEDSAIALTDAEALQQPYWWYLLIAAVAAFVAESVIGAAIGRNQ
ncbi:MAG: BatA and WFA domain-containing protein [Planctomycetota bacterium]